MGLEDKCVIAFLIRLATWTIIRGEIQYTEVEMHTTSEHQNTEILFIECAIGNILLADQNSWMYTEHLVIDLILMVWM